MLKFVVKKLHFTNFITSDCLIDHLGTPVFHGHMLNFYGTWASDARPRYASQTEKRYVTLHFYGDVLEEYASEADLRQNMPSQTYVLPHVYDGTNHVINNRTIYYHRAGTPKLAKYNLDTKEFLQQVSNFHDWVQRA